MQGGGEQAHTRCCIFVVISGRSCLEGGRLRVSAVGSGAVERDVQGVSPTMEMYQSIPVPAHTVLSAAATVRASATRSAADAERRGMVEGVKENAVAPSLLHAGYTATHAGRDVEMISCDHFPIDKEHEKGSETAPPA
jgi:hypothetical protein